MGDKLTPEQRGQADGERVLDALHDQRKPETLRDELAHLNDVKDPRERAAAIRTIKEGQAQYERAHPNVPHLEIIVDEGNHVDRIKSQDSRGRTKVIYDSEKDEKSSTREKLRDVGDTARDATEKARRGMNAIRGIIRR